MQNLLIGRIHNKHSVQAINFRQRCSQNAHREAAEKVIDFLELAHYRDDLIANLPYGVRKKLNWHVRCALNRLLLLDLPASGLNPEETEEVGH